MKPAIAATILMAVVACSSGEVARAPDPEWPHEGSTVFLSERLGGPSDSLSLLLHKREHVGGVARACIPMQVITASPQAGRIVLEDDLRARHELTGDWKAGLHATEAACLDSIKRKDEEATRLRHDMTPDPDSIEATARKLREQEEEAFCPRNGPPLYVSVALPEAMTARSDPERTPLDACARLTRCRASNRIVIARDGNGVYRRLEGDWKDRLHATEQACRVALTDGPEAQTYVTFHSTYPGVPFYRLNPTSEP